MLLLLLMLLVLPATLLFLRSVGVLSVWCFAHVVPPQPSTNLHARTHQKHTRWGSGAGDEAIVLYDQALVLVRAASDGATETRILLGKGVALLQLDAAAHKVAAHSCLSQARIIAAASEGTEAQLGCV
jgi:hypothetical protein